MFFRGSLTVTRDWSRAGNAVKIALYRSTSSHQSGAIAQLGERVVRNDEAVGSIPTSSTILSITCSHPVVPFCPKLVQNNFQRWVPGLASTQFQHLKEGTMWAGRSLREGPPQKSIRIEIGYEGENTDLGLDCRVRFSLFCSAWNWRRRPI
jgi:hypothetical protein